MRLAVSDRNYVETKKGGRIGRLVIVSPQIRPPVHSPAAGKHGISRHFLRQFLCMIYCYTVERFDRSGHNNCLMENDAQSWDQRFFH